MKMKIIVLSTLSILHLIQPSSAISCYICHSRSNPDCADPIKLSKLQLTDCDAEVLHGSREELSRGLNGFSGLSVHEAFDLINGHTVNPEHSSMECQKITFTLRDQRVVIRGCHAIGNRWSGTQSEICRVLEERSRLSPNNQETYLYYCNTCDTDGCNSAPALRTPSPWLTVLLASMVMAIVAAVAR